MRLKTLIVICTLMTLGTQCAKGQLNASTIEVTGSATINIVPDRISVEIGIEEYYKKEHSGDSTIVKLAEIEKMVRATLASANVPDSLIVVTDIGNFRHNMSDDFQMAKRISATVTDFSQIEIISDKLERRGVTSFNILKIDNSNIEHYNRQGLKAAMDAAREKASFLAQLSGGKISIPYEIVENGPNYYETPTFSNVTFDNGSGMENMRRIVRRYSVKVRYFYIPNPE